MLICFHQCTNTGGISSRQGPDKLRCTCRSCFWFWFGLSPPRRHRGKVPAWPTGGVRPTARTQAQFLLSPWGRRAAGTTWEAKGPSQRIQDLSVWPLAFPRAVDQGPPSPGPFLTPSNDGEHWVWPANLRGSPPRSQGLLGNTLASWSQKPSFLVPT